MKRILDKITHGLKSFGKKLMNFMVHIANLLYVMVRCAVCVICNLINTILELLRYIKKKAVVVGTWMAEKGTQLVHSVNAGYHSYVEAKNERQKKQEEELLKGQQQLGQNCNENRHCQSNNCKINSVVSNECIGSPSVSETREEYCHQYSTTYSQEDCEARGCKYSEVGGIIRGRVRRHCQLKNNIKATSRSYSSTVKRSYSGLKKGVMGSFRMGSADKADKVSSTRSLLLDIGEETTTWETATETQRLHRIIHNMERHGLLNSKEHKHEEFVRHSIAHPTTMKTIMKGMVSLLETQQQEDVSQRVATKGIFKLPNKCVKAAAIGDTIQMILNYENPDLLKVLFTYPWDLTAALPELLVAITPITVKGEGVVRECLIGGDRGEGSASKEDVMQMQQEKFKAELDEDFRTVEGAEAAVVGGDAAV